MEQNIPTSIVLVILPILFTFTSQTSAQFSFIFTACGNTTYTPFSTFRSNLNQVLISLSTDTRITYGFYNFSAGQQPNRVEATALCRADVPLATCQDCIRQSVAGLPGICPNQNEAFGFSENCDLFYSNASIFGRVLIEPSFTRGSDMNVFGVPGLNRTLYGLLVRLQNEAASGDSQRKFALGNVDIDEDGTLYGLVQCNPDLTRLKCAQCVQGIMINLQRFVDKPTFIAGGARAVAPSCNLRYEFLQFSVADPQRTQGIYSSCAQGLSTSDCTECLRNAKWLLLSSNDTQVLLHDCSMYYDKPILNGTHNAPMINPVRGNARKRKVLGMSFSIPLSLLIAVFLAFYLWMHMHKRKATKIQMLDIDDIKTMESLKYDLNTIKAATHNFSRDNKLGEGGFGEVYKGKLEAGQEVAVKRLSKSSGQGVQEFKNEVLLIAKLQHKNLVKLLGFCFTSQEKILVYEYLQNSSLDKFLLDSRKKLSFDWQMRFRVIVGIARGLMYLHEDSRLKIIHRDLKPSNILLDDAMVPKISDFGLAKLFEVEETEGDTKRIVGTYGYMAPEYVMTGHFSTKSDIYSFGIIVLEIVSGQKNRPSRWPQLEETLLHRAWRLWNETNPLNLVDSTLDDKYPTEDVRKCIHIGLLCIQENATERPRMTTIVAALNGRSISLPMPRAPNFFGSNGVNTETASVHYRLQLVEKLNIDRF